VERQKANHCAGKIVGELQRLAADRNNGGRGNNETEEKRYKNKKNKKEEEKEEKSVQLFLLYNNKNSGRGHNETEILTKERKLIPPLTHYNLLSSSFAHQWFKIRPENLQRISNNCSSRLRIRKRR